MTSRDTDPDLPPTPFPFYVRALAVIHVLSLIIGPVGFFVFIAIACYQQVRHGFDETVAELAVMAIACPAICALYRRWFEHWGRANWPDGRYDTSDDAR